LRKLNESERTNKTPYRKWVAMSGDREAEKNGRD